jgi:hypothetical protein
MTVQYVGVERTPVVILDDFLLDTQSLISHAEQNVKFESIQSTLYPGLRSILPMEYVVTSLQALFKKLYEIFEVPPKLTLQPLGIYFSLLNLSPAELTSMQMIPHFDTDRTFYLALLHYLNPMRHGGTGFFRHKETGFERINEQRSAKYLQLVKGQLAAIERECKGYCVDTNNFFELYHQIDYQPNRMLIYPGNLLHSGIVDLATDIDPNPATGRLTANMFIEFK